MSNESGKKQAGNTVVISNTVLGQKRAEYQRLTDKGIKPERIKQRQSEDAQQFGVTLDNYLKLLNSLKSRSAGGEQVKLKRKEHRNTLQGDLMEFVANLNALATLDTKVDDKLVVKLSRDFGKFLRDKFIPDLQNTEFTQQKGKQGWMVMLHAPVYNFITSKPTGSNLLAGFGGGWTDASRDYDQYGIRMQAGGKATFYRDWSFQTPVKQLVAPK